MNTIIFNICVLGSNGFDFSGIAHVNVGFIGLQKNSSSQTFIKQNSNTGVK